MTTAAEIAALAATVKPALTVQWILYLWCGTICGSRIGFRDSVVHALAALLRCRTGAFGWRKYTCPAHGAEVLPNSCRRRDCTTCIDRRSFLWAEVVERRLLACEHFHVIFTLPEKILPYWRYNRALMADWLFEASWGTLRHLLAHRDYMGGTPAAFGVLHTHGGALNLHPHVHIVISSVGLAPDHQLVRAKRRGTLLPYRVLRRTFQMKFMHIFARRSASTDFYLPRGTTGPQLRALVDELFALPQRFWNVWILERANPAPVVRYLSRTVYGGPIRNERLVSIDAHHVTFRYVHWRDREEGESPPTREMQLTIDEFVQRWSEHITDRGQKTVRYWGLLAPRAIAS